jgi:hypothetical protein
MNEQDNLPNPTVKRKMKTDTKPLERVTIEDVLKNKLAQLTKAANDSLQGMANITRSDVINLLLKLHDDELSKAETEELRRIHFNVFKCLSWLQNQAKVAKEAGTEISLRELFEKSNDFMSADLQKPIIKRARKSKKIDACINSESPPLNLDNQID